jgi:hypothetical protein
MKKEFESIRIKSGDEYPRHLETIRLDIVEDAV